MKIDCVSLRPLSLLTFGILSASILSGSALNGQDDPPAAVQQRAIIVAQEGDGPQTLEIQTVDLAGDGAALSAPAVFSYSTSSGASMYGLNAAGGTPGMMGMLNNQSIREEIGLVDEQYTKIKDFYKQRQSEIMKEVRGLVGPALSGGKVNNESVQLRGRKLKEMMQKQKADVEEKLKDLLLPHQLKRLQQVTHQVTMKNSGTLNALTRGKLKDELELSDKDIDKLKEKSKEIEEKLNKEIEKLRQKAKQDLLSELSPKQKDKLEELLGDSFEYKKTDWKTRIRKLREKSDKK